MCIRDSVDAAEASDDKPLEVKLIGDPQVERYVEGVVVGDEGSRGGTSGNRLKDRGLDLEAAVLIEILAHRSDYLGPFHEGFLHLGIDDEVYITHTVALLGIGETVVHCSVGVGLNYRKHAQALAQYGESLCVD